MIRHLCPVCDEAQEHSPGAAGMTLPCKHCRSPIQVPKESTAAAEAGRALDAAAGPRRPGRPAGSIVDAVGGWIGTHTGDEPPPPLSTRKRVMFGLLGAFLLAAFGSVGGYGAYSFVERSASEQWATAEGVVEDSGVVEKVGRSRRGRRVREHSAAVHYKYAVNGKEHQSGRVAFGPGENYSFLAKALASQYKPGQKVTVYYDPARPDSAVLKREVLLAGYLFTAVGVFVGYVGLRLLLVALAPTTASSNSRWLPWSRRFTRVDLPLTAAGAVGLALWVPMLFGL